MNHDERDQHQAKRAPSARGAEILREAAALMRERAEAATPGVWEAGERIVWANVGPNPYVVTDGEAGDGGAFSPDNAEHIASWHPLVAMAVADLLDLAAGHEPMTGDHSGQGWKLDGGYGFVDPSCSTCGTPDEYAEPWPCGYAKRGLALAQAYLGTAPTDPEHDPSERT